MEALFVLIILWTLIKGFSNKAKAVRQKSPSKPMPKELFEERLKQRPMTGEEIQTRKRTLQAQYGDKLAEKKREAAQPALGKQSADVAGAFGIPPLQPMEGEDPCHEELYEEETPIKVDPVRQEAPLKLDLTFDRQSLVQAVVLQEILTRPSQRQRRGRP